MIDKSKLLNNPDLISTLTREEIIDLLLKSKKHFENQEKLIELKTAKNIVFIGDLHGDFDALKIIVKNYLKDHFLVFLGDYIDRGPNSTETINYLLFLKLNHPNIILLMGNHEAFPIIPCSPCDFWQKTNQTNLYTYYADVLTRLPLAVSVKNIIALHACLPNITKIEDINKIQLKSNDTQFLSITWDDFKDKEGYTLPSDILSGRRNFGKWYFTKIMKDLNKDILIRGHSPDAKGIIFDKHCLTLMTSKDYKTRGNIKGRLIAIINPKNKIKDVSNLKIKQI
jgi:serine/threonine-protein phosphatase PP1 catalytic subunit